MFSISAMPYVYIGHPSIYHGRKLFQILCQLKNYGQGRIVYRSTEQEHPEPSFYKILLAQPEKDSKLQHGRVVAERVFRGLRRKEPFNLSEEAQYPDFKLVPKDEEDAFCKWDQIKDFVLERDAEAKPKYIEIPPLLKMVVERNRKARNEAEGDLRLPAYKIYTGEHRLEDRVEPNSMAKYLTGRFEDYKDFDMEKVPTKDWNLSRQMGVVGYRAWFNKIDGSYEYKKHLEKRGQNS